ncbi:MAG: MFS transporter [Holosporaceae bacterium]|jgi:MFS family permease|nr:MFS transporter [Holosporaceae bacterium]
MKKSPRDEAVDDIKRQTKSSNCSHCKDGFFFALKNLPDGVFAVSFFGLFLGISTTMIYSQLSLFLKYELGASMADITLLDGVVECISFVVRIFSGPISDFLRERKLILYVGCFITLFARSFIAMVSSWWAVFFVQSSERIGNGIQATPRDALIADLSPSDYRARSFGFSRSMKTIGSLLGTLVAVQIMLLTANNYRIVFACSVIPVIIAIFCLFRVKNSQEIKGNTQKNEKRENPFKKKYLKSFDATFWKIILLALISEMGHFSEHTFPLYASEFIATSISGITSSLVSCGQVLMCFPIGILADKYGKRKLISVCMMLMILANLFFISAKFVTVYPIINVCAGAFLWGAQTTAVQGLFLSLISERVDFHLRATAMGIYFFMLGIAYMSASFIGGKIWDAFGSSYAFTYSMFFSFVALCFFRVLLPARLEHPIKR